MDENDTLSDTEDLLDELIRLTNVPVRRPGDITVNDYATRARCSRVTARTRLNGLVEEGILETEMVRRDPDSGRQIRVWRRRVDREDNGSDDDSGIH